MRCVLQILQSKQVSLSPRPLAGLSACLAIVLRNNAAAAGRCGLPRRDWSVGHWHLHGAMSGFTVLAVHMQPKCWLTQLLQIITRWEPCVLFAAWTSLQQAVPCDACCSSTRLECKRPACVGWVATTGAVVYPPQGLRHAVQGVWAAWWVCQQTCVRVALGTIHAAGRGADMLSTNLTSYRHV